MGTIKRTILLGGLAGSVNGFLLLLLGEGVTTFEDRNLVLPMVAFPVICLALSTGLFVYLFSKLTDRIGLFLLSDFLGFLFSTGLILLLYLEIVPVLLGSREVGAGVGFLLMIVYAGFCVLLLISRIIATLCLSLKR